MNTVAARTIGFAALLITGLTGCAGAPADNGAQGAVTGSSAVSASSPSPTPSPTPTPAKIYSSDELGALLGQLKDAKGVKLSVMSSTDLTGSLAQSKAMISSMTVEPAECQDMAVSGTAPSVEGATLAMGTSMDAADGATTIVSMTSGLDPAFLAKGMAQGDQLSKCAKMSIGTAGTKVGVALAKVDGIGTVPGSVAYRTDTTLPDGRKQSIITAQAVVHSVLISVISMGGATEEAAYSRTGALLDQAAAQIK